MQIDKISVREEVRILKEQFKETEYGFINVLDNVDAKFYTEEEAQLIINKKIDTFLAILNNEHKEIAKEEIENYESNTKTINKKSNKGNKKIRDKIEFDVVIRNLKGDMLKMELTFNERAVYRELCSLAYGKENIVCIDKEIPTLSQLSKIIGKSNRTLSSYFQTLEDKKMIIKEPFMHKNIIYINPLYYRTYLDFEKMSRHTLELFSIKLDIEPE